MDPVSRTLEDLDNPALYEREDNVPIFGPHQRTKRLQAPDGTSVTKQVEVTEQELPDICRKANDRVKRGRLIKGTIGHFRYDAEATEQDQPPIACYYRDFRVGRFGPEQLLSILATRYIRKQIDPKERRSYVELVRQEYPERSADFYDRTREITAVASLKRDADLELGTISYAREGLCVRYLSEEPMPFDETPPAVTPNPADPAAPPDAEAPDPGFHSQFARCMKATYPHMDKMHSAYAASVAPPPLPKPAGDVPPLAAPPVDEPPMPHNRGDLPAQYARLEREQKATAERLRQTELRLLTADRRSHLAQYAQDYELDLEAELKEVMNADGRGTPQTPDQYARHVERIKRCYKPREQDLTALPNIRLAASTVPTPPDEPRSAAEHQQALQYQREEMQEDRNVKYEDALKHVRKSAAG